MTEQLACPGIDVSAYRYAPKDLPAVTKFREIPLGDREGAYGDTMARDSLDAMLSAMSMRKE